MRELCPFHLAIPVNDISSTRQFYVNILGCSVGRESKKWIDFDFFGHQLSAHVKPDEVLQIKTNPVDGENVPVRHFGIVMQWDDWYQLSEKLAKAGIDFLIKPTIRFKGQTGEQATMFIKDPSGNALEFKSFRDDSNLFAIDNR